MKIDENVINYVENRIEYVFKKKELLVQALTHISYANENKTKSYERFEYIGDALLNFLVAKSLYYFHPNDDEGSLTKRRAKMVSKSALCASFKKLKISDYILIGKGQDIPSDSKIYSDIFESIIAAIYFDSGCINQASEFIKKFLISENQSNSTIDYKSMLQELLQKDSNNTLKYKVIEQKGTPNHPKFIVAAILNDQLISKGEGTTKKMAEQNAAKIAYNKLERETK